MQVATFQCISHCQPILSYFSCNYGMIITVKMKIKSLHILFIYWSFEMLAPQFDSLCTLADYTAVLGQRDRHSVVHSRNGQRKSEPKQKHVNLYFFLNRELAWGLDSKAFLFHIFVLLRFHTLLEV